MGSSKFEKLVTQLLNINNSSAFFSRAFKGVQTELFYTQALLSSTAEQTDGAGFRIWGISQKKRKVLGTNFDPFEKTEGDESFSNRLYAAFGDCAEFAFLDGTFKKKRVVVMRVTPTRSSDAPNASTERMGEAYTETTTTKEALGAESAVKDESTTLSKTPNFSGLGNEAEASLGWLGAATDELNKSYALDLLDWQSLYRSLSLPIPEATTDIVSQLGRMQLLSTSGDAVKITNLGALASGRDLRMFDALDRLAIQVVIYRGTGRAEAVATRRFDTGYATSIDAACLWISSYFETAVAERNSSHDTNLESGVPEGSAAQTSSSPYPIAVLRETIANAAAHQNVQLLDRAIQSDLLANAFLLSSEYLPGAGPLVEVFSDRIVISNTGQLNVSLAHIAESDLRKRTNPLTQLLRYYRTRPTPHSGWATILESCDIHRAPIPVFHEEPRELSYLEFARGVDAFSERDAPDATSGGIEPEPPAGRSFGLYRVDDLENARDSSEGDRVRVTLRPAMAFKDLSPEQRLIATYWHAVNRYLHGECLTNGSLRERFGVEDSNSAQISRLIKDASQRGLIRVVDPDAAPKFKRYAPYWA